MSDAAKPEGYPYTTVQSNGSGHHAVLIEWHPNGYEQVSDVATYDEYIEAKREAVNMAIRNSCSYKVPVHG